jgi:hypothetical protein
MGGRVGVNLGRNKSSTNPVEDYRQVFTGVVVGGRARVTLGRNKTSANPVD